ncbi:CLC_0170 family protein [Paenibacillus arenilitoris]|uniref:Uncharacterized protein n=1 Tax=Paenibacillus arenilitoris TaxID=2772299 RepID=A0A927H9A9_9BACL|nr:CLC_0170 family protein [Paenibacillus arenilitoris]MBD2871429.1 hypothetical protein [Paenibacillus arenilitoris]
MIGNGYTMGSFSYVIFLFLICGALILLIDARGYKLAGKNKDHKISRFIGWTHLVLGTVLLVLKFIL